MKIRIGIVLLLLTLPVLSLPCPLRADETEDQVAVTARQFVTLHDAGDTDAAWRQLSPLAQIFKRQEQWQSLHKALRKAYGPLEKRDLRGVTLQNRYAMLPDGRYAIVQFDTVFRNKRTAVETIVLTQSDSSRWLIHDYIIN